MAIVDISEIRALLPQGKRLMGIDHGSKTLGIAVSNSALTSSSPVETIKKVKFTKDLERIIQLCSEYNIGGFIIGLPLNMDGSEGPRVESVRHYGDNLLKAQDSLGFEPVIAFYDERLSTHAMEDFLINERDMSRKKRKEVIDSLAAHTILQGALDRMTNP